MAVLRAVDLSFGTSLGLTLYSPGRHGGHDFEGNYASTTARSGALRRGASREQMNGMAWAEKARGGVL